MENTAQYNMSVFEYEAECGEIVEIPLEGDGTLPKAALSVYFPGATALEFLRDSWTPELLDGEVRAPEGNRSGRRFDRVRSKGVKRKFEEHETKQSKVCHHVNANCTEVLSKKDDILQRDRQPGDRISTTTNQQPPTTQSQRRFVTSEQWASDDISADDPCILTMDEAIELSLQIQFDSCHDRENFNYKTESDAVCGSAYVHHQQLLSDTSTPAYGSAEFYNILENMKQEPVNDGYDEPLPGTSPPAYGNEDFHYYISDNMEQAAVAHEYDEPRPNTSSPEYGSAEFRYILENIKQEPVDDEYDEPFF